MSKAKEKPIFFKGEMVRAILEGRKTQTRRPLKPRHDYHVGETSGGKRWPFFEEYVYAEPEPVPVPCPFGEVGDRLWVRETWRLWEGQAFAGWEALDPNILIGSLKDCDEAYLKTRPIEYRADTQDDGPWHPSIHMPRWASRISLEITNIRVQQLNDITEVDATEEGFVSDVELTKDGKPWGGFTARDYFCGFWDATYGPGKLEWPHNPWVWAVTFKRVEEKMNDHCTSCHKTFPEKEAIMHENGADECPYCHRQLHIIGGDNCIGCDEEGEI